MIKEEKTFNDFPLCEMRENYYYNFERLSY